MTTWWIMPMETTDPEVFEFLHWLDEEWHYVVKKFGSEHSSSWGDKPEDEFIAEWKRQMMQYIDRAEAYGLDDPRARQAIAKVAATAIAFAASTSRHYGPLPEGGTPSGEVKMRSE